MYMIEKIMWIEFDKIKKYIKTLRVINRLKAIKNAMNSLIYLSFSISHTQAFNLRSFFILNFFLKSIGNLNC